jgi:integrase
MLGRLNIADIETSHVLKVLEPIWHTIPQTASRVRSRIEAILAWATVSEFRPVDSPNPARWQKHLDKILPKPGKLKQVKRMATLPLDAMPAFVDQLRQHTGLDALALEFTILCAVRTADIIAAKWIDIDKKTRLWTIRQFSKTHKEHRVPLSDAALHVLERVREIAIEPDERVFPRLHKNTMLVLLTKMGYAKAMTAHGARAAFRTWCQERTNFPREVCEMALGHTIAGAAELAYARSDLLAKRRSVLEAWADYLSKPLPSDSKVIPLHQNA